ncbi:hypothetical protein BDQ17DRAFT_1331027 [Cyathus striatus]|nr:hypothetical protein BDQ17DRAFT_1331027 [Cyathus striatus]
MPKASGSHVGVDLRRILDGFITHRNSEGGPEKYLSQVNSVTYLVKSVVYSLQTLVGDAFILYRLYLVWNGDKRVVFPILVCFIAALLNIAHSDPHLWTRYQARRIHVQGRSLSPAAVVIIESGAIYSICLVVLLALYLSGNYAQYIGVGRVRVALGISSDVVSTRSSLLTFPPRDVEGGSNNEQMATDGVIYSLKPLSVR